MKKLMLISFSMLFFGTNLFCQEKQLVIKEIQNITTSTNINPLLDNTGTISGTYQGFLTSDKPVKMLVTYENSTFEIKDALAKFIIAPKAKRLFNFGSIPGFVVEYDLNLNIYSPTGSLVSKVGNIGHWPFSVGISSGGDFYAACYVDNTTNSSELHFKKLDNNGKLLWELEPGDYLPQNIFISPDGKTIALVLRSSDQNSSETRFYDQNGKLLYNYINTATVTGLEFISSTKFILAENYSWSICELKPDMKFLVSGHLPGDPFSFYPITIQKNSDWFAIVTLNTSNQYHIEIINIKDGSLIAQTDIKEAPHMEYYRIITLVNGEPVLKTDKHLIQFEIKK